MNTDDTINNKVEEASPGAIPNENSGFYFSSFVKIFDPETQEVLLETRGDE
jgi:hypothetical protein|tara:strand:+ start:258 stop:410 length:153 start_codon:yes stop_codon:yes gene_type:complete